MNPRATCLALGCLLSVAWAAAGQDPEIGPQIQIDVNGGIFASNETSAAASRVNPGEIVATWNDWRDSPQISNEVIRVGVALSLDGGRTWDDFLLRPPAGFQTSVEGDPMTAFDPRTGALWVGGISFGFGGGMFVARKDPGATEFEPAVMTDTSGGLDKGWMAAGPRPGEPDSTRVYIALNAGVQWSDDMGDTWTSPVSLGSGLGFLPRVGPGGELYVAYWQVQANEFRMQRSLDGGGTFTTHLIAQRMDNWSLESFNSRFPGEFRVPPLVYLAVDPNDGTLYATFMDTTDVVMGNSNVDLYFTRSFNQGETWSVPLVLNGDADPPGDQFFPWLEVDQAGRIHAVYFDSRHTIQDDGVSNGMFDAYYAYSANVGSTWSEFRLTPASFNSDDDGLARNDQFIGDYLGIAATDDVFYPVYLDTTLGDTNVYTNVITFPTVVDADVNDDGVVDVQDLTQVILDFGACPVPPGGCPSDTNGDGVVNTEDLVNVILAWS